MTEHVNVWQKLVAPPLGSCNPISTSLTHPLPRPCKNMRDATGLSGGGSRSLLLGLCETAGRCHSLVGWSFKFLGWLRKIPAISNQREPPRGKPVASRILRNEVVAANVNLHPTSGCYP